MVGQPPSFRSYRRPDRPVSDPDAPGGEGETWAGPGVGAEYCVARGQAAFPGFVDVASGSRSSVAERSLNVTLPSGWILLLAVGDCCECFADLVASVETELA
ncbi:MAG: hypothetical protein ACI8TP_004767 [Acidimicrobiales bacterium]|jgi:hypothetical protein